MTKSKPLIHSLTHSLTHSSHSGSTQLMNEKGMPACLPVAPLKYMYLYIHTEYEYSN